MNRIEFKMNPTKRDFEKAAVSGLLHKRNFWVYVSVIIAVLMIMEIIANLFVESTNMISKMAFVLMILIFFPLAISMALARRAFALYHIYHNGRVYHLSNEGYGVTFGKSNFFMEWRHFKKFKETDRYIFLDLKRGRSYVIFKHLLSKETVCSIKQILAEASVPEKKLIA